MTNHDSVEAAVREAWQDVVRRRQFRRRGVWLTASAAALACAAVIVLVVQFQSRPAPAPPLARNPLQPAAVLVGAEPFTRHEGARFRASDEDRVPDGGLPRRVLASYSWEPR